MPAAGAFGSEAAIHLPEQQHPVLKRHTLHSGVRPLKSGSSSRAPFEEWCLAAPDKRPHQQRCWVSRQRRQVLFDDKPDSHKINAQVAMHAHAALGASSLR